MEKKNAYVVEQVMETVSNASTVMGASATGSPMMIHGESMPDGSPSVVL